ncbi:MAG: hypothetical protein MUC84_10030 [Solirubrobacteraceae bacterium]|jgi:hypothetical protein|nr:hypothetical protein [Solirubrobacteraceae bacterium]
MRLRPARTALAIAALGAALALPASALGATAATDRACYVAASDDAPATDQVIVSGTGFTPGGNVNVLLDGKIIDVKPAAADGTISGRYPVPKPPQGGPTAHDRAYQLLLQQDGVLAQTSFRAVDVFGDVTLGSGDPRRMRVRFSAFGFAARQPAGAAMPALYVHYVDPRGKLRRTVPLGRAQGPCGTIRRTALKRLFPFAPRNGDWTFQFDAQKKYKRGTASSSFPFYALELSIGNAR